MPPRPRTLAERARALGAIEHHQVDARADYFEQVLRFLIMGNVRRGQLYPLCVGAERVMQAQTIARMARKLGTDIVAHGCTAAGNDQVRFEVALRTLAPDLRCWRRCATRPSSARRSWPTSRSASLPVPPYGAAYSVNRGLWGVTIGGKETLTSDGSIPDEAWVLSRDAFSKPRPPERHVHQLRAGRARARSTAARPRPVELIESSRRSPRRSASAAASIWATPSSAPRAAWPSRRRPPRCCSPPTASWRSSCSPARQQRIKDLVAQPYGDLVHEGQLLDPVCRDIEALLLSSQAARDRRGARAAAAGQPVRRGRRVALLADGRLARASTARRRANGPPSDCARLLAGSSSLPGVFYTRAGEQAAAPEVLAVAEMRRVVVDKIASVTQACGLSHEVRISADIPAEEGVVVVVEILTNKSTYNTLELTSGRMAKVGKGDIVVGALGHRKALFGYSGHVPETRAGPATSSRCSTSAACWASATPSTPTRASPSTAACSGVVLQFPYLGERIGVPARVGRKALDFDAAARHRAACRWSRSPAPAWRPARPPRPARSISRMRHRGLIVDAFKATGVSLRRDILAMEDAGARQCADLHRPRRRHHHAAPTARRSRAPCSPSWPPASPT